MKRVMVRYTVKPEWVQENVELVRAVYDELRASRPAGFRYATLQLEDGVSFVHIAEIEDGPSPLPGNAAFGAFQKDIAVRCDEPPRVSEIEVIGSYGLFSDAAAAAR